MTANTLGIARCTVGVVVHEICQIFRENINPQLVKFPYPSMTLLKPLTIFAKIWISPGYRLYWWYQSNNQVRMPMNVFLTR